MGTLTDFVAPWCVPYVPSWRTRARMQRTSSTCYWSDPDESTMHNYVSLGRIQNPCVITYHSQRRHFDFVILLWSLRAFENFSSWYFILISSLYACKSVLRHKHLKIVHVTDAGMAHRGRRLSSQLSVTLAEGMTSLRFHYCHLVGVERLKDYAYSL